MKIILEKNDRGVWDICVQGGAVHGYDDTCISTGGAPVLEEKGVGQSGAPYGRLVVPLENNLSFIKEVSGLVCYPQPPEEAKQLGHAANALASAAHELACVLKEKS